MVANGLRLIAQCPSLELVFQQGVAELPEQAGGIAGGDVPAQPSQDMLWDSPGHYCQSFFHLMREEFVTKALGGLWEVEFLKMSMNKYSMSNLHRLMTADMPLVWDKRRRVREKKMRSTKTSMMKHSNLLRNYPIRIFFPL